jgi:hypothetical protein
MADKIITADCNNCESTFEIAYEEELVSDQLPSFCPFCGEAVEDVTEQVYEEDDEDEDIEGWE